MQHCQRTSMCWFVNLVTCLMPNCGVCSAKLRFTSCKVPNGSDQPLTRVAHSDHLALWSLSGLTRSWGWGGTGPAPAPHRPGPEPQDSKAPHLDSKIARSVMFEFERIVAIQLHLGTTWLLSMLIATSQGTSRLSRSSSLLTDLRGKRDRESKSGVRQRIC